MSTKSSSSTTTLSSSSSSTLGEGTLLGSFSENIGPIFIHPYATIAVKSHVPMTLELQNYNYTRWSAPFCTMCGKFELLQHIDASCSGRWFSMGSSGLLRLQLALRVRRRQYPLCGYGGRHLVGSRSLGRHRWPLPGQQGAIGDHPESFIPFLDSIRRLHRRLLPPHEDHHRQVARCRPTHHQVDLCSQSTTRVERTTPTPSTPSPPPTFASPKLAISSSSRNYASRTRWMSRWPRYWSLAPSTPAVPLAAALPPLVVASSSSSNLGAATTRRAGRRHQAVVTVPTGAMVVASLVVDNANQSPPCLGSACHQVSNTELVTPMANPAAVALPYEPPRLVVDPAASLVLGSGWPDRCTPIDVAARQLSLSSGLRGLQF